MPDEFDNYGDNIIHEVATNDIIVHNIEDDSDTIFVEDDVEEAEKNKKAEENEILDI